jgi:hypothetical protein
MSAGPQSSPPQYARGYHACAHASVDATKRLANAANKIRSGHRTVGSAQRSASSGITSIFRPEAILSSRSQTMRIGSPLPGNPIRRNRSRVFLRNVGLGRTHVPVEQPSTASEPDTDAWWLSRFLSRRQDSAGACRGSGLRPGRTGPCGGHWRGPCKG